ncbi:M13 family metallopeptidase [Pseudopedobacter sp.]|uniref:M13 family metallopeptidase n=1 Tax=Pseudopedobacter sp. TaxID=1936787 RepID=UPI003341229A
MRLKSKLILSLCAGMCCLSAYADKPTSKAQDKFIDPANMDLSVKPGDDFYTYASGTWIKNNPVPPKETQWGSFNVLMDFNINAVKDILVKAAANNNAPAGSIEKRVGDFYAAGMDTLTIEKLGYTPIQADLAKISAITSKAQFVDALATLRVSGLASPLFDLYVEQDSKNPEVMIPQFFQGGTTLPDRDYYLKDDNRSRQIREAYIKYINKLFVLTGSAKEQAAIYAKTILSLETELAKAQMSRVELRDPQLTYNKLSVQQLTKDAPTINFEKLLPKMLVNNEKYVLVNSLDFFITANKLVEQRPLNDLKIYLKWNILKNAAAYLSSDFVKANFQFNQVITGQKVPTPRWQKISSQTDKNIGELLGQLYVSEYFKPEAKARMDEMIRNLSKAFEIRINNLDWMSAETKVKALEKLKAFTPKIGYPSKWQDYNGLVINRKTYFQNLTNAEKWSYQDMVNQLGKPIDKTRWGMTAPTVNAYYNPVMNEIVFPAGILQFPFFDPNADDAVNYGGIGAVIGHEISHGFDDAGSQYDAKGALNNWWTKEDREKFDARTEKLVNQFNNYKILDTLSVNGRLTLGENIGDLGGLNAAYTAFKMTKEGQSKEKIDGFTPDQRFFLSWAQVWRGNILPETASRYILMDPHSPEQYRTIGPLVNMDEWYTAFDVRPGDKLYKKPEDRIKIW